MRIRRYYVYILASAARVFRRALMVATVLWVTAGCLVAQTAPCDLPVAEDPIRPTSLIRLFERGDECVPVLQAALDGQDMEVASEAARALGYLGTIRSREVYERWLSAQKPAERPSWLPIIAPLREFEYLVVEEALKDSATSTSARNLLDSYIPPLTIDGSPRARDLLRRISAAAREWNDDLWGVIGQRAQEAMGVDANKPIHAKTAMAALRSNMFFVPAGVRKDVSLTLLASRPDATLILVEHVCGGLCASWHYVVLRRDGEYWKFISVTLASLS